MKVAYVTGDGREPSAPWKMYFDSLKEKGFEVVCVKSDTLPNEQTEEVFWNFDEAGEIDMQSMQNWLSPAQTAARAALNEERRLTHGETRTKSISEIVEDKRQLDHAETKRLRRAKRNLALLAK